MTYRLLGPVDVDGWTIARDRTGGSLRCSLCGARRWQLWLHQPSDTFACGRCRWPAGS